MLTQFLLPLQPLLAWHDTHDFILNTRSHSAKHWAIFKHTYMQVRPCTQCRGSTCQLPPNKLLNGCLAALFLEVTCHKRTGFQCLGSSVIRNHIAIIDNLTMGKVSGLSLKVQSESLNAQWVWHICWFSAFEKISTISTDKKFKAQLEHLWLRKIS